MTKTIVSIHEIESKGFWIKVEQTIFCLSAITSFVKSDGSLSEKDAYSPKWILSEGLYDNLGSAQLDASRFTNLARLSGNYGRVILKTLGE